MDVWQPTSSFITISHPITSSKAGIPLSTGSSPVYTPTQLYSAPTPTLTVDSAHQNITPSLNRLARRRELQYRDSAWADLNPANIKDLPTRGERAKFGFLFALLVLVSFVLLCGLIKVIYILLKPGGKRNDLQRFWYR